MEGQFTDGSTSDLTRDAATVYTSSDPSTISVTEQGLLTAENEGVATVTITHAEFGASLRAAAEFRTGPELFSIDLEPFSTGVTTDDGSIGARARADRLWRTPS